MLLHSPNQTSAPLRTHYFWKNCLCLIPKESEVDKGVKLSQLELQSVRHAGK